MNPSKTQRVTGRYKFLGKPDRVFPYLKTGKTYDLRVEEIGVRFLENPTGWLWGLKRPVITSGLGLLTCPYSSWGTFKENWELLESNNDNN